MRKQISIIQALVLLLPTTIFAAGLSFDAKTDFNVGITPCSVMVGDLNADGFADMATANVNSNNVSFLAGNGDGTFQAAVNYSAGLNPHFVSMGDVNADGKTDLVVANGGSNNVSILLGNGNGTFQAAINYAAGRGTRSVAMGDFNADGIIDVVATNMTSNDVSILRGNGDGTFQAAVNYPVGPAPYSVAMADLNADGSLDLATANFNSNTVSILVGNGDGTFQSEVTFVAGTAPRAIAIADINADGRADLAVTNKGSNNVSILLGNGNATFQAAVHYAVGTTPYSMSLGDLNADGLVDIAVANVMSSNVSILRGNGDGTFQAAIAYSVGVNPTSVVIMDVNGDAKSDLAVSNATTNNVSVLINSFETPVWAPSYPQTLTEDLSVAEVVVNVDRSGTAYMVCLNENSTAPSSTQIKAGQNASSTVLPENLKASTTTYADNTATLSCTSLTKTKVYDLYVVSADQEGTLQLQPNKQIKMTMAPRVSWVLVPSSSITGSYKISWARTSMLDATYKVEVSSDGGNNYELLTTTSDSWHSVSGQVSGTYQYRIVTSRSEYVDSEAVESSPIVVDISCGDVGSINLPTSNSTGSYRLGWARSSTFGASYDVSESFNGGPYQLVTTTTSNYLKFAWKTNGSYSYQIQAKKTGYAPSSVATSVTMEVMR